VKRLMILGVCVCAVMLVATPAFAGTWNAFIIRNATTSDHPPTINNLGGSMEFILNEGGMKAGWGTSALDGFTLGQIAEISIDRLDDYTRYTAGSGAAVAPYFNIWVTDGSGNYAVVANEPSNAEWQPGNQQWNITDLTGKTAKAYENTDMVASINGMSMNNGVAGLQFDDIYDLKIQAPTAAELGAGWTGLGSGAPRELGTNIAYGFSWVFGDTQANYVSGDDGYIVANPLVAPVPEPISMIFFGTGVVGVFGYVARKRLQKKA